MDYRDIRKCLEPGTQLKLVTDSNNKETVKIEKSIGRGAGTICYDAWVIDDIGIKKRRVIVKECFPIRYALDRKRDNNIHWLDEDNRRRALDMFKMTKERNEHIQSIDVLMDSCSHVTSELFSANDTQYIFIDKNNHITFREKITVGRNVSVFSVVSNILALAQVIEKFHKLEYLLLDIKPENFIVREDNDSVVKIIDFDSIVSIDEIREGVIKNLSYTEMWAAPEVKAHKWSDIGIESDVFSVGAVLFYGITKTFPDTYAKINDYDILTSPMLNNVNPKAIKELQYVINKMLSASVKNRYSNMKEVCISLEKIKAMVDPERMYLRNNMPKQTVEFTGRKKELRAIKQAFSKHDIVLINDIYGSGGMGKTELARRFAIENASVFKTIVFADCSNGIEYLIRKQKDLTIENYEFIADNPDCVNAFINMYKGLVDSDTLLILDDIIDFNESYFNEILKCKCKFLITTRKRIENIFSNWSILSLKSMEFTELQKIFYSYCKRILTDEDKELLPELFNSFYNITTYIPAIGSLVNRGKGIEELLKEVSGDSCLLENEGRVTIGRNNLPTETSITELTEHLLRLGSYSDDVLAIFSRIALLGHDMIYRNRLAPSDKQILVDEVVTSGIVTYLPQYSLIGMNDVYGDYYRKKYGVRVAGGEELIKKILCEGENVYNKEMNSLIFGGRWERENIKCMLPYLEIECFSSGIPHNPLFNTYQYKVVMDILRENTYDRTTTFSIIIKNLIALIECIPFDVVYMKEYDTIIAEMFCLSTDFCVDSKEYEFKLPDEYIKNPISVLEKQVTYCSCPWDENVFNYEKDMPKTYTAVTELCIRLLDMVPCESLIVAVRDYARCTNNGNLEKMCNDMLGQDYTYDNYVTQDFYRFLNISADDDDNFIWADYDDFISGDKSEALPLNFSGDFPEKKQELTEEFEIFQEKKQASEELDKMLQEVKDKCQYAHQFGEVTYRWLKENIHSRTEICRFWSSISFNKPIVKSLNNIFLLRLCEEGILGEVTGKEQFTCKIGLISEYFCLHQYEDVYKQINELKKIIHEQVKIDNTFITNNRFGLVTDLAKWTAKKGELKLALQIAEVDYSEKKIIANAKYAYKERLLLICQLAKALNEEKILAKALESLNRDLDEIIIREDVFNKNEYLSIKQKPEYNNGIKYDVDKMMDIKRFKSLVDKSNAYTSISFTFEENIKIRFEYSLVCNGLAHMDCYEDLPFV